MLIKSLVQADYIKKDTIPYKYWCKYTNYNTKKASVLTEQLNYKPNLKPDHHSSANDIQYPNAK
jgi:hypothetical protein